MCRRVLKIARRNRPWARDVMRVSKRHLRALVAATLATSFLLALGAGRSRAQGKPAADSRATVSQP